jgi:hypothetical protein
MVDGGFCTQQYSETARSDAGHFPSIELTRIAGSAALLAGAALAAPAVAHAAPAICSTSFDPYTVPTQTLDACGMKWSPLTSKTQHPDGSTDYTYAIAGGVPVTYHALPPGFDAAHASPAELAHFGIPARPPDSQPEAQQFYDAVIPKLHSVPAPDKLIEDTGVSAGTSQTQSANWSGYFARASGLNDANGQWYEPTPQTTVCPNSTVVIWAGLTQNNSGILAQDGTGMGVPGLGAHQAWWEIFPTNFIQPIAGMYATAGQGFKAITDWYGPGGVQPSPEGYRFRLVNQAGATVDFTVSNNQWDGGQADFIVERATVNGQLSPLMNFQSVNYTVAWANGASQARFNNWQTTMAQNGITFANAGAVNNSDGGFGDAWKNC